MTHTLLLTWADAVVFGVLVVAAVPIGFLIAIPVLRLGARVWDVYADYQSNRRDALRIKQDLDFRRRDEEIRKAKAEIADLKNRIDDQVQEIRKLRKSHEDADREVHDANRRVDSALHAASEASRSLAATQTILAQRDSDIADLRQGLLDVRKTTDDSESERRIQRELEAYREQAINAVDEAWRIRVDSEVQLDVLKSTVAKLEAKARLAEQEMESMIVSLKNAEMAASMMERQLATAQTQQELNNRAIADLTSQRQILEAQLHSKDAQLEVALLRYGPTSRGGTDPAMPTEDPIAVPSPPRISQMVLPVIEQAQEKC